MVYGDPSMLWELRLFEQPMIARNIMNQQELERIAREGSYDVKVIAEQLLATQRQMAYLKGIVDGVRDEQAKLTLSDLTFNK